tara:strand:+ start:4612 stop:6111 length:1500 start_codon:yes stop_codon:yes gene_type:complete
MIDILTNPKRRKNLFYYFIFALLCLPFVFLDPSFLGGAGSVAGYAAKVNDNYISIYEHRSQVDQLTRFYSQVYGPEFGQSINQRRQLAAQALQQLVSEELITQKAHEYGLYVSDLEVAETIRSIEGFQRDGIFQKDIYDAFLKNSRVSAGEFEKRLRKQLISQKVRAYFMDTLVENNLEREKNQALDTYKRKVSYLKIQPDQLKTQLKISQEDVEQAMANPDMKKEIQDYFAKNKESYQQEEQVRARHILFRASSEEEFAQANKKAKELRDELNQQNFADKAKEISEDPGTKKRGGDLGYFARGAMVPEFEQTAFSMKVGEISEPVKTAFGYHLLLLEDKKSAKEVRFADVEEKVTKAYLAEKKAKDLIANLEQYVEQKDLQAINQLAEQEGWNWETTKEFDLEGRNLGSLAEVDRFLLTAFSLSKEQPLAGRLLRSGDERYLVRYESSAEQKVEPTSDKPEDEMLGPNRSPIAMRLMDQWLQEVSQQAKIVTNESLLR